VDENPQDLDRLIQEVLTEYGGIADAKIIANRVRKLNYGLPAEDEFSVICSWLGRCEVLHKLDQLQSPISSKTTYQVPDILAKFSIGGPYLVEVKSKNSQTLSFKPDYYSRLLNYAELLGIPLLIAWKYHSIWTLFDIRHLQKARVNFNIKFDEAMRQNLMGVIVGDVAYKLAPGAGVHLKLSKEKLIESTKVNQTEFTETWQMRVSDIYFTVSNRNKTKKLHPETIQMLITSELEKNETHFESYILQSFEAGLDGFEFAHRGLVRLLNWEGKSADAGGWRALLHASEITKNISHFGTALNRALKENVVSHILNQQPADKPDFIDKY